MRSWGWGPHDGISVLIRRGRGQSALSLYYLRTQRESGHLRARRESPQEPNGPFVTFILDFPASRTIRNKCLLFKPPSLWYFVMAAWVLCHVIQLVSGRVRIWTQVSLTPKSMMSQWKYELWQGEQIEQTLTSVSTWRREVGSLRVL